MKKNKAEYKRECKQGNFKQSDIWMDHFKFCNDFQDLFLSSITTKTAQPSHFEDIHSNITENITILIADPSPRGLQRMYPFQ